MEAKEFQKAVEATLAQVTARQNNKLVMEKKEKSEINSKRSRIPDDWVGIFEDLRTEQWYVLRHIPE
jgi:hypothetical protein